MKTKLFSNYAWLRRRNAQKFLENFFLLYNLQIFASDQIKEESN